MGLHVGQDIDAPNFLAVVDLDPDSDTYGEIVDRVEMPNRGDELHHFGWNACSSSCHIGGLERRHLVIPGQRSSRIHIVDTKDRREPEMTKVIEPEKVYEYDLSAPHTVHCIPDGEDDPTRSPLPAQPGRNPRLRRCGAFLEHLPLLGGRRRMARREDN
jgi:selenium-binding protein 1